MPLLELRQDLAVVFIGPDGLSRRWKEREALASLQASFPEEALRPDLCFLRNPDGRLHGRFDSKACQVSVMVIQFVGFLGAWINQMGVVEVVQGLPLGLEVAHVAMVGDADLSPAHPGEEIRCGIPGMHSVQDEIGPEAFQTGKHLQAVQGVLVELPLVEGEDVVHARARREEILHEIWADQHDPGLWESLTDMRQHAGCKDMISDGIGPDDEDPSWLAEGE